ncbi:MAG: response regulator [Chloroflexi bacterium]|nr:response regulator [Ktedonobacteraceae bacterium]MBV9020348.1 response regulator [Ktedonobacteraceae bacterium]MBV9708012.1 response regulator [Chloroflexota bacterium]
MRVGLIEDDLAIREMLRLVLEDEECIVITYSSAEECLQALGITAPEPIPSPVDLLIVDWRLSGDMSGIELIRQIRTKPHLSSLPIILTTAATFDDIEELQHLHVTFLEKPFSVDEITTLIKNISHPIS